MARRPPQPLRLVHDEQIDARRHGLRAQLLPFGERLERDHRAPVQLERIEAVAEVAPDVGEAAVVEQREDLVILAPQLAEPLHRERRRRHHEAALDLPAVHQMVEDEARLDGLPEADFVSQQPADRVAVRGPFGHVELVREQSHPAAQEGAEAARFADTPQVQDVEPDQEIARFVGIAQREPIEQRAFELERPQGVGRLGATVGELQPSVGQLRRDPRFFTSRADAHRPAWSEVDGDERIGAGGQAQRRAGPGKLGDERASVEGGDAPDAQFGIEAVGEVVADGPGRCWRVGHRRRGAGPDARCPAPCLQLTLPASPGAPPRAANSCRLMKSSLLVS